MFYISSSCFRITDFTNCRKFKMSKRIAKIIDFNFKVFATNRGVTTVRGTESVIGARDGIRAPHGMPVDLLDRLMIIKTAMYSSAELKEIAKLRAKAEGVDLTPNGLDKLGEVNLEIFLVLENCQIGSEN